MDERNTFETTLNGNKTNSQTNVHQSLASPTNIERSQINSNLNSLSHTTLKDLNNQIQHSRNFNEVSILTFFSKILFFVLVVYLLS
jgi:Na+/pantothenate symporter